MGLIQNPELLKIVIDIRRSSSKHLPIDNSLIPFDLLFKVVVAHTFDQELTVKGLFTDLPHSEMGMRYHLRRLLAKDWIAISPSNNDKRSKIVLPTNKLMNSFNELNLDIKKILI